MSLRARTTEAVIVLMLAISVPCAARAQGRTPRGFQLYSSTVAVAFDSGVTLGSTSPFGDQLFQIVPTAVAYTRTIGRSDLQFIYEPEIEIYASASELNALNHAAGARYQTELSRSVRLDTGGTFLRTDDRARQAQSLTLTPRGKFVEGRVNVNVSYAINRDTNMGFRVDGALSETELPTTATTGTAPESIEQLLSVAGVDLSRTFARSHSLSVSYGYVRTATRDPRLADRQVNQQDTLSLAYSFSTRFGLNTQASVGIIRGRQELADDTYTHLFTVSAGKRWDVLSINARYGRTIAALLVLDPNDPNSPIQVQDPTLTSTTVQNAGVGLQAELLRRVRVSQNFRWSRSPSGVLADEFFESLGGSTQVAVRAGNTVAPYVTVGYWLQNSRTVTNSRASRYRISAGLRFYWNRLVGAPGSTNIEPARSVLPGRRVP